MKKQLGLITAPILAGCEALANEPMVVNSQLVPASVQLVGNDGNAVAKTIADRVTGVTLVEAGSGASPTFGVSGPGRPGECKGIRGEGGKYLLAGSSYAAPGTQDIILEAVLFKYGDTLGTWWCYPADFVGARAFLYNRETAVHRIAFQLYDGTNYGTVNSPALTDEGAWHHLIWFMRKASYGICYANAVAGSEVDISAVGAVSPTNPAAVFGSSYKMPSPNTLACLNIWMGSGLLDTHLQLAIAQRRFAIFSGYLAAHGHASLVPTLPTRTSAAYTRGF